MSLTAITIIIHYSQRLYKNLVIPIKMPFFFTDNKEPWLILVVNMAWNLNTPSLKWATNHHNGLPRVTAAYKSNTLGVTHKNAL